MKQGIQLTGKNIDDLFRLPCVFQIQNGYEIWTQAKVECPAKPKVNKDGNNGSVTPND